jgi:hypothetical protein
MQTERRHNPYPLTWEIPAGILTCAAALLITGVHLGRALANWATGAGWHWPATTALLSSLPAVLGGDATAGLTGHLSEPAAPADVFGWIVGTELLIVVVGTILAVAALRRWGPGRLKGMATAAEAEASLGRTRLRRVRHIIRPDLYPARPNRLQPATDPKESS